ncbi:MAG: aconitate hydratase, partial [Burkholderiales bacterium]|nr:aconitate hydratase [Anaerolineae bacterium]
KDIWPTLEEIRDTMANALSPDLFQTQYANVYTGNETWNAIEGASGDVFKFDPSSTYIQLPPFFENFSLESGSIQSISGARVLAMLGDSVTTDHISPAGDIATYSPAGRFLQAKGIQPRDFNTYGARRGSHEVMMRGTFANIRLRNRLIPGSEGGITLHLPSGEELSIFDAAMRYIKDGTPLVILAGIDYGMGSSRDWAAKGTALLGVKAVIAKSYERIHRSNLVMMGVLPLQFLEGEDATTLGLTGTETFDILGLSDAIQPKQEITVQATAEDGTVTFFKTISRMDFPVEIDYYRNGGILQTVLRKMIAAQQSAAQASA